jgi:hypothetical protein
LAAAAAAAVPTAASQGLEDLSDLAAHRLEPRIMFRHSGSILPIQLRGPRITSFHPDEDPPDMSAVLFVEPPVFRNLVHLPKDDLAQVPDRSSHHGILAPQLIHPYADLSEPGGRPIHMIPEGPRQASERQSIPRVRHLPRSPLESYSTKSAQYNACRHRVTDR